MFSRNSAKARVLGEKKAMCAAIVRLVILSIGVGDSSEALRWVRRVLLRWKVVRKLVEL
jgi:hypothetical protein